MSTNGHSTLSSVVPVPPVFSERAQFRIVLISFLAAGVGLLAGLVAVLDEAVWDAQDLAGGAEAQGHQGADDSRRGARPASAGRCFSSG